MNKKRIWISVLFCVTAIGMLSLGHSPVAGKDIVTIKGDSTTTDLAKNYKVVAVRDAIAKCRAGKYSEALPVLTKYSDKNDLGATYVLARLYASGLGVEASEEKASQLLLANISGKTHVPSMLALAELKQKSQPAIAIQFYKRAAGAGETTAMARLGSIYENGQLGVKANPKLAFSYFEKAANAGYPVGDFHLARCYDSGVGVSANEVLSTRLYRKAALGGVNIANAVMARRYFEGKGIEADPIAAIGWLTRGAQNGSPEAMVLLGERYQIGDTLKQDLNRAGQLYSQATKMGDPTGTYKLAMLYQNGIGTKPDPVRAYVLLANAQSLPKAKEAFELLGKQLTPEQIATANKTIEDAKNQSSKK